MRLHRVKIRNDAVDMEVNEGLLPFFAEEEVTVLVVVHEVVFGEDGGAAGMAKEVKGGFLVGVAIGVVGAETHAGEMGLGGVAVDGDEDDVLAAQLSAPLVHAAAALGQGDGRFLRHQKSRNTSARMTTG